MKNKASGVVKHIISVLSSIAKRKTDAMKARFVVFSLMKNERSTLSSISHKIHAMIDRKPEKDDEALEGETKAVVLHSAASSSDMINADQDAQNSNYDDDDNEDKYPDLTHSLFDDEDEDEELNVLEQNASGSIVDMVKSSMQDQGEDFVLEDEIDHVADLFIRRFRKQIRLQKLESFKRYQEMMERSA